MSAPYSSNPAWPDASNPAARSCSSRKKVTESTVGAPLGERDLGDFYFGERLAVAVELADALLRLIAEDENFLVFRLAQNRPGDRSSAQGRGADRYVVAAGG